MRTTVQQIIDALSKCDPNAEVELGYCYTEYADAEDSCGSHESNECDIKNIKIDSLTDRVVIAAPGYVNRCHPSRNKQGYRGHGAEEHPDTKIITI